MEIVGNRLIMEGRKA